MPVQRNNCVQRNAAETLRRWKASGVQGKTALSSRASLLCPRGSLHPAHVYLFSSTCTLFLAPAACRPIQQRASPCLLQHTRDTHPSLPSSYTQAPVSATTKPLAERSLACITHYLLPADCARARHIVVDNIIQRRLRNTALTILRCCCCNLQPIFAPFVNRSARTHSARLRLQFPHVR